jgi:hypothetical protein
MLGQSCHFVTTSLGKEIERERERERDIMYTFPPDDPVTT